MCFGLAGSLAGKSNSSSISTSAHRPAARAYARIGAAREFDIPHHEEPYSYQRLYSDFDYACRLLNGRAVVDPEVHLFHVLAR